MLSHLQHLPVFFWALPKRMVEIEAVYQEGNPKGHALILGSGVRK